MKKMDVVEVYSRNNEIHFVLGEHTNSKRLNPTVLSYTEVKKIMKKEIKGRYNLLLKKVTVILQFFYQQLMIPLILHPSFFQPTAKISVLPQAMNKKLNLSLILAKAKRLSRDLLSTDTVMQWVWK